MCAAHRYLYNVRVCIIISMIRHTFAYTHTHTHAYIPIHTDSHAYIPTHIHMNTK